MSNVPNQIENVLIKRRQSVKKVDSSIKFITELSESLNRLDKITERLQQEKGVDNDTRIIIDTISQQVPTLIRRLAREGKIWENLKRRFSRSTVNIGVIGRQRQGKSTFLQNVTSLSKDEIPARKGEACTSVQSVIYHSNRNEANVYYYSEKEFLDQVIHPYFKELTKYPEFELHEMPMSLEGIDSLARRLKSPQSFENFSNTVVRGWYDRFYNIVINIDHYRVDVSKGQIKPIEIQEINQVVQYQYGPGSNILNYNFIGIKKVVLHCPFNNQKVEKLGLIDLPGLGDIGIGDDIRLIRALREDVDLTVFLKYPAHQNATWEEVDQDLYGRANQILEDRLPLDKWSILVLNKDQRNRAMCEKLENGINSNSYAGVKFAKSFISDISKREEAEKVLEEAIFYLAKSIEDLDQFLIAKCGEKLKKLKEDISKVLVSADKLSRSTNIESRFDEKFEIFFKGLRNTLVEYRMELNNQQLQEEKEFIDHIKSIIQNSKESVNFPTQKEFQEEANRELTQYLPYHSLIHHIRSCVLRNFHDFTKKQQVSIDKQKEDIASLLSRPNLLGGLQKSSNKNGLEFLIFLKNMIEENPYFRDSGINEGFDFICRFHISYESYAQELIYSIFQKFFSDKVKELNSSPDYQKIYSISNEIININFPEVEQRKPSLKRKKTDDKEYQDRRKTIVFLEKNASDLTQICVSVIGLFPGAEMITNFYEIARSIVNIINKEKEEEVVQQLAQKEIDKLKYLVSNSTRNEINKSISQTESLTNLKRTLSFVLNLCQEELIQALGSSTFKIRSSMTREFFDHIAYTRSSEKEWREFLRQIREQIWIDFKEDYSLNEVISEWNQIIESTEYLIMKNSSN